MTTDIWWSSVISIRNVKIKKNIEHVGIFGTDRLKKKNKVEFKFINNFTFNHGLCGYMRHFHTVARHVWVFIFVSAGSMRRTRAQFPRDCAKGIIIKIIIVDIILLHTTRRRRLFKIYFDSINSHYINNEKILRWNHKRKAQHCPDADERRE